MRHRWIALVLISVLFLAACGDDSDAPYDIDELPDGTDVSRGEEIFKNGGKAGPACASCHRLDGTDTAAAPSLKGFANRADDRVDDLSAWEYAFTSILTPGEHLVAGYGNAMYGNYGDDLSKQEVADVIAYLLTLDE
ncbi:MAG: cytochrome c [Chloroflexi bacterium]|nr:cytochrome c [Chloroflexota bacterium]